MGFDSDNLPGGHSEDIYREHILDHYKNPRNAERMEGATWSRKELNTSCGDEMEFFVELGEDGKVLGASFDGVGCAISQAAISMLTENVIGKTPEEIGAMTDKDIFAMLGVPVTGSRARCATLGLKALQNGAKEYGEKK